MYIELLKENGETLEYSFDQDSVKIGRSQKCEIRLIEDGISRQHLQIDVVDGEIILVDLGSTNGVFVNKEQIESNARVKYLDIFDVVLPSGTQVIISLDKKEEQAAIAKQEEDEEFIVPKKKSLSEKTKVLDKKTIKANKKALKSKGVPQKKSPLFAVLIACGIATAYFVSSESEETYIPKPERISKIKAFESKEKPIQFKYPNFPAEDLSTLIGSSDLCSGEPLQLICEKFSINKSSIEGILFYETHALAFVDYKTRLQSDFKEDKYKYFLRLKDSKKQLGIIGNVLVNPRIIKLLKENGIETFRVYAVEGSDSGNKLLMGAMLDLTLDYSHSLVDHMNIFQYYFLDAKDGFFKYMFKNKLKIIEY